jgi:hypothetical protein
MKIGIGNTKLSVALTTTNLVLWVWAVSRIKHYGDSLTGPYLISLIALMLAALIQYRSVLDARQCHETH